jgi:site-specific DNA recombinase
MPEITGAALRLAIYARVSTEEQREGQTIDSQIAELERFAREKAWPIVGTYKDEGWSGGVMEWPDLDRLRDDAQKGVFDAVLINDVDRLARDVAHLGVIKRDLERQGIKVIFRKLPLDTSPTYNLMVNILGSFAEFERELISDRTRRGRRHKVEVRKQYLGSNTAYGYRYIPKDRAAGKEGILEVVPEEASVVRQMFEWVDRDGLSARRVLNRLDELRIQPRKKAASWGKSSVLRILHSEMYAGVWHYNKFQGCEPRNPTASLRYRKRTKCSTRQRTKSEWLPLVLPESLRIVPRDRWERVQRQLDHNIRFSPRNEKHAYLLKGLVRCGACGASFVGDPCHGKFYYRCTARCKKSPSVRETVFDDSVKEAVKALMLNPDMILKPRRELDEAEARERAHLLTAAQAAEAELSRLKVEEERILDAYRTGVITPAQLGHQLEKLKTRRAALELEQSNLRSEDVADPEQVERAVLDYCTEAASSLAHFTQEDWREFLRTLIHRIIFEGRRLRIQAWIPVLGAAYADADLQLQLPVAAALSSVSNDEVPAGGHGAL